jgi:hypothetical protein
MSLAFEIESEGRKEAGITEDFDISQNKENTSLSIA